MILTNISQNSENYVSIPTGSSSLENRLQPLFEKNIPLYLFSKESVKDKIQNIFLMDQKKLFAEARHGQIQRFLLCCMTTIVAAFYGFLGIFFLTAPIGAPVPLSIFVLIIATSAAFISICLATLPHIYEARKNRLLRELKIHLEKNPHQKERICEALDRQIQLQDEIIKATPFTLPHRGNQLELAKSMKTFCLSLKENLNLTIPVLEDVRLSTVDSDLVRIGSQDNSLNGSSSEAVSNDFFAESTSLNSVDCELSESIISGE